jgi:hypothetical protein
VPAAAGVALEVASDMIRSAVADKRFGDAACFHYNLAVAALVPRNPPPTAQTLNPKPFTDMHRPKRTPSHGPALTD